MQVEKKGLLHDLKQVQVDMVETEKKDGDFIMKVQKEVKLSKRLKYE